MHGQGHVARVRLVGVETIVKERLEERAKSRFQFVKCYLKGDRWLTPLKPSAMRLLGRPPPLGARDFP
ncbi:hypothetical protein HaLaN_17846 [Haematococcus lacustris]|uniref:Uncharacterized protein n=1 Tax=Haematococcus lacustris TaxID=44745 RepID=A0A699ZPP6_HAELA|nr:hypothetical protein HaLaN_17846 [Haematococcus lacustris]